MHTTSLLDLSFSLPLIIEFFDRPEKISVALEYLATVLRSEHLIFFTAQVNGAQKMKDLSINSNEIPIKSDEVPIESGVDN